MYKDKRILAIIPARGGSKGLPGKNIKPLNGKPLIYYSIDVARQLLKEEDICVSTDDLSIIEKVEAYGLKVRIVQQPMMYYYMLSIFTKPGISGMM